MKDEQDQGVGASADADQALVNGASASPVSALTGFDPSRFQPSSYEGKPRQMPKGKRHELEALRNACNAHIDGLTPYRQGVLLDAMLSVSPINCSWQHYALAETFFWHTASAIEARSGETGEARLDAEGTKARPEGDAQPSQGSSS